MVDVVSWAESQPWSIQPEKVCVAVPTGQMRQQAASILLQKLVLVQGFSATKILHFQEVAAGFDEIFSLREDAERYSRSKAQR